MKSKAILFLDIETVPLEATYDKLPEAMQQLWTKKSNQLSHTLLKEPSATYERAGIYAEFGKIVTIAVGYFDSKTNKTLRIKAFADHEEKVVLNDFKKLVEKHFNKKELILCAHNGKEFDFPYIARRMIINQIPLPDCLQLAGKKPWQIPHLDTLEMWKFGDYKHFTSLDLLANIFDIPTSKDDIDGSQVYDVYYNEKDLRRISEYCKKDVAVLAQVYLRLTSSPLLANDQIIFIK